MQAAQQGPGPAPLNRPAGPGAPPTPAPRLPAGEPGLGRSTPPPPVRVPSAP